MICFLGNFAHGRRVTSARRMNNKNTDRNAGVKVTSRSQSRPFLAQGSRCHRSDREIRPSCTPQIPELSVRVSRRRMSVSTNKLRAPMNSIDRCLPNSAQLQLYN